MFIKVCRQGATTRQIAGAASGTHEHDIEITTLSVANEYQANHALSGLVYGVSLKSKQDSFLAQAKISRETLQWN